MQKKPLSIKKNKQAEPELCFFIATVLVIYSKDDAQKQRHMNVLLEASSPQLNKATLGQIQHGAISRLKAENNVDPENVLDVVIFNICPMGMMSSTEFHGIDAAVPENAPVN